MAPSPLYNGWPYNGVKWGQHKAIEGKAGAKEEDKGTGTEKQTGRMGSKPSAANGLLGHPFRERVA